SMTGRVLRELADLVRECSRGSRIMKPPKRSPVLIYNMEPIVLLHHCAFRIIGPHRALPLRASSERNQGGAADADGGLDVAAVNEVFVVHLDDSSPRSNDRGLTS